MHSSNLYGVPDMIQLVDLFDGSIFHNMWVRYMRDEIYTYCGNILVAMNPYKWLPIYTMENVIEYKGMTFGEKPPHIFAVANESYVNLGRTKKNQCVVISGESGSGKTESTKLFLQYLASVSPKRSIIQDQILEASPILEAFGNAKTVRNDNSSRFGKFIEVQFSHEGDIVGAKTRHYLLEKSRIVSQAEGERNYHVFYQLLAGCSQEEKADVFALTEAADYNYLNQSGCLQIASIDDVADFKCLCDALRVLQFGDYIVDIFRVVASVLHVGNITFQAKQDQKAHEVEGSEFEEEILVQFASNILGLEFEKLKAALVTRTTITRGETFVTPLSVLQASDSRDAMAKALYSRMFDWIVGQINSVTCSTLADMVFVGILDIFGFEDFKVNSFEQFCINYANERLQFFFNQYIFKIEQDEYAREGLTWSDIKFQDNQPCIDLVSKKPVGLLYLVDEESNFPKGTDQSLLTKFHQQYGTHSYYVKPKQQLAQFGITHYAGEVTYQVAGFLDKNRDTLRPDIHDVLAASTNRFVAMLFAKDESTESTPGASTPEVVDSPKVSVRARSSGSIVSKMAPMIAGPSTSNSGTLKPQNKNSAKSQTLALQFHSSLNDLISTLTSCNPFFIRCIKPNTKKEPQVLDRSLVMSQLRYCGMLETIKIRRLGFSIRISYDEFWKRYRLIYKGPSTPDQKAMTLAILEMAEVPKDQYFLGKNKVLMKEAIESLLEELRTRVMHMYVKRIEKFMAMAVVRRRYLRDRKRYIKCQQIIRTHLEYKRMKRFKLSVIKLQSVWRGVRARREWKQKIAEYREAVKKAKIEAEKKAAEEQRRRVEEARRVVEEEARRRKEEEAAREAAERNDQNSDDPLATSDGFKKPRISDAPRRGLPGLPPKNSSAQSSSNSLLGDQAESGSKVAGSVRKMSQDLSQRKAAESPSRPVPKKSLPGVPGGVASISNSLNNLHVDNPSSQTQSSENLTQSEEPSAVKKLASELGKSAAFAKPTQPRKAPPQPPGHQSESNISSPHASNNALSSRRESADTVRSIESRKLVKSLMILDEMDDPFEGLDPEERRRQEELLKYLEKTSDDRARRLSNRHHSNASQAESAVASRRGTQASLNTVLLAGAKIYRYPDDLTRIVDTQVVLFEPVRTEAFWPLNEEQEAETLPRPSKEGHSSPDDNITLAKLAQIYFRENVPLKYSKKALKESLLALPEDLSAIGCDLFKVIRKYTHEDSSLAVSALVTLHLWRRMSAFPPLIDEVYCQLFRNTVGVKDNAIADRTWKLVSFLSCGFAPNSKFFRGLSNYVMTNCAPDIGDFILRNFNRFMDKPFRQRGITTLEVFAIENKIPLILNIAFSDNTSVDVEVDPATTCNEVLKTVIQAKGLQVKNLNVFTLSLELGNEEIILTGHDYILDIVAHREFCLIRDYFGQSAISATNSVRSTVSGTGVESVGHADTIGSHSSLNASQELSRRAVSENALGSIRSTQQMQSNYQSDPYLLNNSQHQPASMRNGAIHPPNDNNIRMMSQPILNGAMNGLPNQMGTTRGMMQQPMMHNGMQNIGMVPGMGNARPFNLMQGAADQGQGTMRNFIRPAGMEGMVDNNSVPMLQNGGQRPVMQMGYGTQSQRPMQYQQMQGSQQSILMGSVPGSQQSIFMGSVQGSQQTLMGSIPGSQQTLMGSVPGSQQNLMGSVPGSQQNIMGAMHGSQQNIMGSVRNLGGMRPQMMQQQQPNMRPQGQQNYVLQSQPQMGMPMQQQIPFGQPNGQGQFGTFQQGAQNMGRPMRPPLAAPPPPGGVPILPSASPVAPKSSIPFPWQFYVRRAFVSPDEKFDDPTDLDLTYKQLVRALQANRSSITMDARRQASEYVAQGNRMELIKVAQDWPLYFAKFFTVKQKTFPAELLQLAVDKKGVHVVDSTSSHKKILMSCKFDNLIIRTSDDHSIGLIIDDEEYVFGGPGNSVSQSIRHFEASLRSQSKMAVTFADYVSNDDPKFSFKRHKLISVFERDSDNLWLYGGVDGNYAWFPREYAEPLIDPPQFDNDGNVIIPPALRQTARDFERFTVDHEQAIRVEEETIKNGGDVLDVPMPRSPVGNSATSLNHSSSLSAKGSRQALSPPGSQLGLNKSGLKSGSALASRDNLKISSPMASNTDLAKPTGLKRSASQSGLTNDVLRLYNAPVDPSQKTFVNTPENIAKYTLLEYAKLYFNSDSKKAATLFGGTKKNEAEWGWKDLVVKVKYTDTPIKAPLHKYILDPILQKTVLDFFQHIMMYMGDLPTKKSRHQCASYLIQMGMTNEKVRDELYCQVMKQITNNRSVKAESCKRGWDLLALFCTFFPPSTTLEPYVFAYCLSTSNVPEREFAPIAADCENRLYRMKGAPMRVLGPSEEELFSIECGAPLSFKVYFPDNSFKAFLIDSFTTSKELTRRLREKFHVDDSPEFALLVVLKPNLPMIPVLPTDRLLDIRGLADTTAVSAGLIANHVERDKGYSVRYERLYWLLPLEQLSPMAFELVYHQARREFLNGNMFTPADLGKGNRDTLFKLVALQTIAHPLGYKKESIVSYVPPVVEKIVSKPEWETGVEAIQKTLTNLTPIMAKAEILKELRKWDLFGAIMFIIKGSNDTRFTDGGILYIMPKEFIITNSKTRESIMNVGFDEVISFHIENGEFIIRTGDMMKKRVIKLTTDQGFLLQDLFQKYLDNYQKEKSKNKKIVNPNRAAWA
ncbi:hypothetical protein BKA69DRAFT_219046 [Paraphysoderma sedebokerense]|nr:hypothetical protein BKA69DRAFT_219046 [Paraphysoderma sedebokerense]